MQKSFKKLISGLVVWVAVVSNVLTPMVNAYTASSASTSFIMPDHDVSLQATSQANSYTIKFNGNWNTNTGTTMADLPMTYDVAENLTANAFTKVGYTFQWWNTNSWATTATYQDGESVSNLVTAWNVTLYAIWKANVYQVAFDKNPDSDTQNIAVWTMSNQDFVYDTAQTLTWNKFTRAGYTFAGWSLTAWWTVEYTDGQSVENLTATSWGVVTLYAKWTAKTNTEYTVNHYLMDLNGEYPDTPTYTSWFTATTYAIVSPEPRNDEWFTLSGTTQSWHVKWDGTTVFNYYYSRDMHNVTLHAGRGVESVAWGGSKYYNQSIAVSAILRPWYENLTWTWTYDTANFNMPASDVDMTANATPITYTITLDVWSGTISWQPTTYNVEQTVNIPDPTRTWYDFVWWSWTNITTPTSGLTINPSTWHDNLNLVAVWKAKDDVVYVVHHYYKLVWENTYEQYWADEVHTDWTADDTLNMDDFDINIPCTTYAGWSLTQSTSWLTNEEATFRVMPDGSTHVYLYYTRNVHNVELSMDGHIASVSLSGEDSANTITRSFECGAEVSISATPKTWYHFLQWSDIWAIHLNP